MHLAAIYYEPSWRGGDQIRPLCLRDRPSKNRFNLTSKDILVSCPRCLALMAGRPVPKGRIVEDLGDGDRATARHHSVPAHTLEMDTTPASATMREITERIATDHGRTLQEVRTAKHKKCDAYIRQEAMSEIYGTGEFSNRQIAGFFNLTDHTSVIHARQRHAERMAGAAA